ncbi:MAG TPA: flavodoxin, partial [Cyanobacteria bacterium UBA11370]|nr:flavodoxin [Cyanobacteria bacterium UBA11370]
TPDAPPGLVSNWLHDTMRVGREIKVSGPLGKFTCFAHPAQKLLMISAGSGITPMMAMSRWIVDTGADCDIVFFHSARSPRDIIFRQELEWMSACQPKFRLAITITKSESGQPWCGFMGRLNESMLSAIAPDFMERTVYVCGSNAFMAEVKILLEHLAFPMQNYYEESFAGTKQPKQQPSPSVQNLTPAPTPAVKSTPSKPTSPPAQKLASTAVIFAKSKKEIVCDGKDSILELAEQEGIEMDSNCRSGVCGTCKQKKLAGEIKYEDDPHGLDHSDEDEGYILTCIAHPVGRVVINA